MSESVSIGVVGLGYVGLPLVLALGKRYQGVVGFDLNQDRVKALAKGEDKNKDIDPKEFSEAQVLFTTSEDDLSGCNFLIVAVPTPIDEHKRPDLGALKSSSELIGRIISRGAIVVYESTVYPGVTEEFCGPIIAEISGLKLGEDFKLGYSPERVNPGDREHTIDKIVKVVSAEDQESLDLVAEVYGSVVTAGIHKASSIKVAEAAKVIENTQRDLNIALMNELAIIFDRMDIPTQEVLEAAGTKWNFLKFKPGLVGGHCIGVDPYYLTTKAEMLGYPPRVILSGRSVNDGMGAFIAQKAVKQIIHQGKAVKESRVGILGLTFKENVSDLRNSKVPDIISELYDFGAQCLIHDPQCDPVEAQEEFGLELVDFSEMKDLDALILCVSHDEYLALNHDELASKFSNGVGVFVDVKSVFRDREWPEGIHYWSL